MILCAGPGKFNSESLSATSEIIILCIYFVSHKVRNKTKTEPASKEVELVLVLLGVQSTSSSWVRGNVSWHVPSYQFSKF